MWRKRKAKQAEELAALQADRAEARRQTAETLAKIEQLQSRRPLVERLSRSLSERAEQNHFIETLYGHLGRQQ